MKLLMTADAVGGVWQYATELAGALQPHGIETVLAMLGPIPDDLVPPSGPTMLVTGLPLDWLVAGPDPVRAAGDAVAALARRIGADLVQLNSPALAAEAAFPCPVVAVAHGCVGTWWDAAEDTPLPPDLAWHAGLMGAGLAAADAVVAPSASFAALVQRRYGLAHPPHVVHNGRTAPPLAAREPARHALTAGRLWDRAKNVALLDRVAAHLPVPLRAAGAAAGPHGEAIATRHLDLLGSLSEAALRAELAQRPVFVSAARFEPFGLAVLEAAQAGCALVLAELPTFRELWDGAALFVAGDDARDWAEAIGRVVDEPGERQRLGEAARLRSARYTPAATAAAMARIYRDALAGATRAAA